MSKATAFLIVHDRLMDDAHEKISIIRQETDKALEALAIKHFGAIESHEDDGFGPPSDPVKVECWHCGEKYSSAEMRRQYRPRMQHMVTGSLGQGISVLTPLWWCRDIECDGGGFGHDIHAVKPRKPRQPKPVKEAAE